MADQLSHEDRLSYYGMDQARRQTLKNNQATLMKAVPVILDDFYEYVTQHPASKDKFSGHNITGLKKLQGGHWETLFSGEFSLDYVKRSVQIGQIHERVGITPFIYVGGYTFVLNKISDFIIANFSKNTQ